MAAFVGAAVVSLGLVVPTSAFAVGCYGSTCDNKGPVAMGCNKDAVNVRGTTEVMLTYSKACNAYWVFSTWAPQFWDSTLYVERGYYNATTKQYTNIKRLQIAFSPGETAEWTNMLGSYGPNNEGFLGVRDWHGGDGVKYTGWHCHKRGCPPWV
ncbi:hypothetical protein OG394_23715 [Kribbella sp. NBC_01245]|uniref:hypothetical protein n=1 Tax=Kribbella sp. NBC_01245 TaxID=2903578 RepID=UPI002E2AB58F|nr:hypothetical protein [Kribbella sp. NBC_01245]